MSSLGILLLGKTYWSGEGHPCNQEQVAEGQRDLDLFRLEKTKVRGDLTSVCNSHTRVQREDGDQFFSEVHSDRKGGNECRLEQEKF